MRQVKNYNESKWTFSQEMVKKFAVHAID